MKNYTLITLCLALFCGGIMLVEYNPLITLAGMILALFFGQFIQLNEDEEEDVEL